MATPDATVQFKERLGGRPEPKCVVELSAVHGVSLREIESAVSPDERLRVNSIRLAWFPALRVDDVRGLASLFPNTSQVLAWTHAAGDRAWLPALLDFPRLRALDLAVPQLTRRDMHVVPLGRISRVALAAEGLSAADLCGLCWSGLSSLTLSGPGCTLGLQLGSHLARTNLKRLVLIEPSLHAMRQLPELLSCGHGWSVQILLAPAVRGGTKRRIRQAASEQQHRLDWKADE